jgi:hypothetical protein
VLIAWEYLSGLRRNSLDWDTLGIIVLFIIALATPLSWSNRWFVPLGNAALFALMLGTILIGRPFAEEYGKESAPAEVWNIRALRQATLGISVVWTAAVGVIVVGSFITALKPSTEVWSTWVVAAGAIIIAIKFQHWYRASGTYQCREGTTLSGAHGAASSPLLRNVEGSAPGRGSRPPRRTTSRVRLSREERHED